MSTQDAKWSAECTAGLGLPGEGQSGGGRLALSHAKPGAAKGQTESLGVT